MVNDRSKSACEKRNIFRICIPGMQMSWDPLNESWGLSSDIRLRVDEAWSAVKLAAIGCVLGDEPLRMRLRWRLPTPPNIFLGGEKESDATLIEMAVRSMHGWTQMEIEKKDEQVKETRKWDSEDDFVAESHSDDHNLVSTKFNESAKDVWRHFVKSQFGYSTIFLFVFHFSRSRWDLYLEWKRL